MDIPKEIADRIHYKRDKHDPLNRLVGKIDPISKPCEDCGAICNRVINGTLNTVSHNKYWRLKCSCGLTLNIETGKYEELGCADLRRIAGQYFNKKDK